VYLLHKHQIIIFPTWYDSNVNTDIPLFVYPLTIGIGVGVGLIWAVWSVSVFPDIVRIRIEAGAAALGGAVIGGRVSYTLVNWGYFQSNIAEIPQFWLGGFSWIGVVAGSCLAIPLTAYYRKKPVGVLVDGLRPLIVSTVVSVWLASWMVGYAYGVQVEAWWGIPAKDEWGIIAHRWPIQMVAALSALGVHWLLDYLVSRKWIQIPGLTAILELGGFFMTLIVLSPFRGDPTPTVTGMRLDTFASIIYVILCLILVLTLMIRTEIIRKTDKRSNDYEN
jgi:prolipoprotein diacylglyceryltransferase